MGSMALLKPTSWNHQDFQYPQKKHFAPKSTNQLEGFIFRQLSKIGIVLKDAICSRHINRIVKQVAKDAMIMNTDQVSAHSSKYGYATEAVRLSASIPAIQKYGSWKPTKTIHEYNIVVVDS